MKYIFQKYCSQKCHRRTLRKDINQPFYNDKKSCTVCTGVMVPRFEFIREEETNYLCSQPCLNVFKFANSYKAGECRSCFCPSRLLVACKLCCLGLEILIVNLAIISRFGFYLPDPLFCLDTSSFLGELS